MKPPPSAKPIKSILKKLGCIGLWIMNKNGGLSVFDLSGKGNHADLKGNTIWTPTKYGSGCRMDADGDCLDIYNYNPSIFEGLGQFTLLIWCRSAIADRTNERHLWYQANTLIVRQQAATEKFIAYAYLSVDDAGWAVSDAYADTDWHQVVVVYDGAEIRIYVDTKLGPTTNAGSGITNANANRPFIGSNVANQAWNGDIDHAVMCNRPLSTPEIIQLYREPFYMFGRKRQPVITPSGPPPEVACQWSSLTTNLWWLKHSKGLFTKL